MRTGEAGFAELADRAATTTASDDPELARLAVVVSLLRGLPAGSAPVRAGRLAPVPTGPSPRFRARLRARLVALAESAPDADRDPDRGADRGHGTGR